jgi:hypothetical protein
MRYLLTIALSLFIFCSLNLSAETAPGDEDRFFYGSETDEDLQTIIPDKSFSSEGIQYGAIISPLYLSEDTGDESLSSSVLNVRIWGKSYLWSYSYLYLSLKDSYTKILSKNGDSYKNTKTDNIFDLDQAFIAMTYFDAALQFSAGRKYYSIGTGLVLNGRGDGAQMTLTGSVFSLNLIGLYTGLLKKDNNPYGLNTKDYTDGAERVFSGGVFSAAAGNQQIYMFGLAQVDRSKQDKSAMTKYNSQYYGSGINGVILEDVSYFAEAVFQSGESYINSPSSAIPYEKSKIAAFAVNTGINYFIPLPLNPTLTLQYAFGTGDDYRTDYTSGNRPYGASGYDKGFISFGTYSGGYALKPVLSNIHIYRAGLTFVPFSSQSGFDIAALKKMSIGAKYSHYIKDKTDSPINSGNDAKEKEDFIGKGVDVSLRWQIFYDASFYMNYGLFLPGDACTNKDSQSFLMAGMNLSF